MGNRVSGTLTILAMDKFEGMFVYQELLPLVYVHFVDDVGTVVKNQEEAENTLEYLNSRHPTIMFEMELPSKEGFLPLLDSAVQIDETGNFRRKLFPKKANKGIVLMLLFSPTRFSEEPSSSPKSSGPTGYQRINTRKKHLIE